MTKLFCKDLTRILDESRGLNSILGKVRLLQKLNKALSALLSQDLSPHCQIVNIRDNQLIIAADNAAWATQLRYQSPDLLEALRSLLANIAGIKIIIQNKTKPESNGNTEPSEPPLSQAAAHQLESCAASIKDESLSAVLRRLAGRSRCIRD